MSASRQASLACQQEAKYLFAGEIDVLAKTVVFPSPFGRRSSGWRWQRQIAHHQRATACTGPPFGVGFTMTHHQRRPVMQNVRRLIWQLFPATVKPSVSSRHHIPSWPKSCRSSNETSTEFQACSKKFWPSRQPYRTVDSYGTAVSRAALTLSSRS